MVLYGGIRADRCYRLGLFNCTLESLPCVYIVTEGFDFFKMGDYPKSTKPHCAKQRNDAK